ncbi:24040_t:CDS:2 [Cetraspora pellucida]|uniref:24040_t:CDS:1 n=1 Tax=Cetraspora pellucida TaxID=1433469 RepID=A0A9N8W1A1_9GLOM|nr:24040_t:CDS:2 [Cetraspora pellucida]
MYTETQLRQLKIPDLKEILSKESLPVSGKKEELISRILAAENKKTEEALKQTSNMDISNVINNDTDPKNDDVDIFDKDLLNSPNDLTTGLDNFDWEKFTTDDIDALSKDNTFDSLISPTSPSHSTNSNKDNTQEKVKSDVLKDDQSQTVKSDDTKKTSIKDDTNTEVSKSDVLIKPSGFTCKKIVFDEPTSPISKSQSDLNVEIERRKKRAERFGTQLSEADKKLQRAARFGVEVTSPIDSPLKASLPLPTRKLSTTSVDNDEKLRKRAEKFGLDKTKNETPTNIMATSNSLSEEEKKKKRAEKFGLVTTPSPVSTGSSNVTNIATSTSSSLSTLSEEEKKKRRAEKFSTDVSNGEPSSKKVKA